MFNLIKPLQSAIRQALGIAPPQPVRPMNIDLAVLHRLMQELAQKPDPKRYDIQPPELPKNVVPAGHKSAIAQDSASFDYASQYFEGQGFMGYAVLSMMALRSEYRAAVEVIANECTRKWIELKSTATNTDLSEKITALNEEMERLNLRDIFRTAIEHDGFFGRGQIYINIDNCPPEKRALPLVISDKTIKQGALKGFKNIEPIWTTPQNYNTTDPTSPDFYRPLAWWVLGTNTHSDRLLTVISRDVPDMLKPAYNFGGLSLIQIMQPYVERWWRTVEAVANLVNNYSTSGIKTDMGSILQSGYTTDETAVSAAGTLINRIKMFVETRDNRGLMLLDKELEEFFQFNVPLSGLDGLLAKAQEQMCMPCHIPLVKYTGITPSGLNASSEGEIAVFYDWIHSEQENNLRQPLTKILQVMQLSLFGELDNSITFDFCPLEEMTELELATIRETEQRIDTAYIGAGVLAPEEPRQRLRTDKNSGYQNLDDAAPELPETEPDEDEKAAMDAMALDRSEHWVTINGARVLIDGEGQVIGGAGGKLNGRSFPDASRSADRTGIHPHDDLLTAIAKKGGLSREAAIKQGIDPAMLRHKTIGGHRLFNNGKNAKNYDEMSELVRQYGYEAAGENDLVEKVHQSVNNNIHYYTPEGHENNAKNEYKDRSDGYDWQHEQRKQLVINAAKSHDEKHKTQYFNAIQSLEHRGLLDSDELSAWEDDFGLNDSKHAFDAMPQDDDMAFDAERWITVHPNGKESKGQPALIDGEGTVKGGMGGKFNGKNIKDAHGTKKFTSHETNAETEARHAEKDKDQQKPYIKGSFLQRDVVLNGKTITVEEFNKKGILERTKLKKEIEEEHGDNASYNIKPNEPEKTPIKKESSLESEYKVPDVYKHASLSELQETLALNQKKFEKASLQSMGEMRENGTRDIRKARASHFAGQLAVSIGRLEDYIEARKNQEKAESEKNTLTEPKKQRPR